MPALAFLPTLNRRLPAIAFGLALLAALALPFLLHSQPAPRYTIADLGVLPGDSKSGAFAINNQGAICGYTQAISKRACVFQNGTLTVSVGPLAYNAESLARGLNAQGAVTGDFGVPPSEQAFVFHQGRMTALGTLPGFSDSRGVSINAAGEVAGKAMLSLPGGGSSEHAFVYSHGKMTDLGALLGGTDSGASSINAAGQVVGFCYARAGRVRFVPFLYDSRRKTMTLLPMPAPYVFGYANSVNDSGQVAGNVSAGSVVHAALWSGGKLTDIGTPPGYDDASAEGLNNHGEIVGRCFQEDTPVHTFLQNHAVSGSSWQRYLTRRDTGAFVCKDGKLLDLSELIPEGSGWTLQAAHGINDRGQIVGMGLHNGQERAFLLTPH